MGHLVAAAVAAMDPPEDAVAPRPAVERVPHRLDAQGAVAEVLLVPGRRARIDGPGVELARSAPAHLPQEQAQQRGHVPGAINIPWSTTANEDGTFKSDEDLAKLYADKGFDDSKETIAYCRIGERSSHTWFVLHELLGLANVKNYDGSWTEYGSLVGVPIALGDEPGEA